MLYYSISIILYVGYMVHYVIGRGGHAPAEDVRLQDGHPHHAGPDIQLYYKL